MDKQPVCIFTSDLHFSDKRPICRKESDWFEYQKGVMVWLNDTCEEYVVPLVAVGDIFDRSRHSNELVNLVIDNMPYCYVTSGNHDNPYNSKELQHKSAYGTFIRSEKATELNSVLNICDGINLFPYHFGQESGKCNKESGINIALVHELVWHDGNEPFKDAPKKGNVEELVKRFQGFDIIVAGDNHEFFMTDVDDTKIINNGSLMCITAKQKTYQPLVHLLYTDGSIEHIPVPVEDDMISTDHIDSKKEITEKIGGFVTRLQNSEENDQLSFEERIQQAIVVNEIDVEVKEIILEEMENG